MDLLGKVVHRGACGSQMNQHIYVAIAQDCADKTCLVVNFTTKRGTRTSAFTIEVKKSEFPQILTSDISTVEYGRAESISESEFIECGIKKDSYGKPIVCPDALMKRILAQIDAGSDLKNKFVRKYFPNSPIL